MMKFVGGTKCHSWQEVCEAIPCLGRCTLQRAKPTQYMKNAWNRHRYEQAGCTHGAGGRETASRRLQTMILYIHSMDGEMIRHNIFTATLPYRWVVPSSCGTQGQLATKPGQIAGDSFETALHILGQQRRQATRHLKGLCSTIRQDNGTRAC